MKIWIYRSQEGANVKRQFRLSFHAKQPRPRNLNEDTRITGEQLKLGLKNGTHYMPPPLRVYPKRSPIWKYVVNTTEEIASPYDLITKPLF